MSTKRLLYPKQIVAVQAVASDVYVLSFKRDFSFSAGQVVAIDLVSDGQPRLYSIASGEKDEYVDILFDEKPDGNLTPRLSQLKNGDFIYVSDPFGTFTSENHEAYWIAAGTGVAPFVSMIRSGLSSHKILVHGGRMNENFYFSPIIEQIMGKNYVRCSSQLADTQHYKGRLTEWLKTEASLPIHYHYYLCGSPEMVVQVRDILIERNIPFKNIVSETYF